MKWATETMHLELTEEGILIIVPPEDFKGPETVQHARENIRILQTEIQDRVKAILAYMPSHYVNAEATHFYKNNAPEVPAALIADSFFKRMIGNFMLTLTSGDRPIKLFAEKDEAMKWLQGQLKS